jgi:hypothetical protein
LFKKLPLRTATIAGGCSPIDRGWDRIRSGILGFRVFVIRFLFSASYASCLIFVDVDATPATALGKFGLLWGLLTVRRGGGNYKGIWGLAPWAIPEISQLLPII